jgi:hypothetical protein
LVEASRSSDPRYKLNDGIDLWRDTSIEDLNFGFSNFNHLGSACEGGTKMIEKIEKKENIWKAMMESTVTVDNTDPYYSYWITRSNFYIVNSPIFNGFIMFVIMLNTIVLSLD